MPEVVQILMMKARAPGPLRAGHYGGLGDPVCEEMLAKERSVGEKTDFLSVRSFRLFLAALPCSNLAKRNAISESINCMCTILGTKCGYGVEVI